MAASGPAELRALGLDPSQVLDFSASISPLGTPAGLWDALRQVDLTTYPGPGKPGTLREALAAQLNVSPQRILVGNGSTEIIHLLTRAYLTPRAGVRLRNCFAPDPDLWRILWAPAGLAGANIFNCNARVYPGITSRVFSWGTLTKSGGTSSLQRAALTFVCNPNNPYRSLLSGR